MPPTPILITPGVDAEKTAALNATGWSQSSNIRFFQSLPQKMGGFRKFCQALVSPATAAQGRSAVALRAWAALSGIDYLAIAGENRVSLFGSDIVSDITPITHRSVIPLALSTVAGSAVITVTDPINTPVIGNWLRVVTPVAVGGVVVEGAYGVMTIIDASHYTIASQTVATATVTNAGTARVFITTAGSAVVTVVLPNHGLFTGQVMRIAYPVVIDALTLEGNFVVTVIDPNTYTIVAEASARAPVSVTENGGNLVLLFTIPPSGGSQNVLEAEFMSLDNWGEFLLAIPKEGPVFVWMPETGPSTPLQPVTTAPGANAIGFVANQQQILILGGSVNAATGLFDPLLARWSDAGDYTQFTPLPSNQAGSFRLQLGSAIIGGLAIASGALLWTDIGVYTMQYEGLPLVWGFQPIGINCGLIGPKAVGVIGSSAMWMSREQFYVSAGGAAPQQIPCSVWDRVFKNLDPAYARQIACVTNAYFNEIAWYVPQIDDTVVKAKLQLDTGQWDYTIFALLDSGNRSAGIDQNVFGPPLGATPGGAVYQEETGTDADDAPLVWRLLTGIATIAEGDQFTFFKQVRPDIKFSNDPASGPGTVAMRVYVYRNPQEAPRVKGPFLINARTRTVPCRGRGRGLQFEFSGSDFGSSPRLGRITYTGAPDGRGG